MACMHGNPGALAASCCGAPRSKHQRAAAEPQEADLRMELCLTAQHEDASSQPLWVQGCRRTAKSLQRPHTGCPGLCLLRGAACRAAGDAAAGMERVPWTSLAVIFSMPYAGGSWLPVLRLDPPAFG